jgi:hypothetical protein
VAQSYKVTDKYALTKVVVDDSELFKGESSQHYATDHNLLDKPMPPDLQKLTGLKTLRDVADEYEEGVTEKSSEEYQQNPNIFYAAFQQVVAAELEAKGYKGAVWSYEDDLSPEQYQIWDHSVEKKHNESYSKLQRIAQDVFNTHLKLNYKCKAGTVDEGFSCSAKQESDRMDKESKAYNEFDSKRRLGPTKIDFFKSPTTQKFVALQAADRYALSGNKEDLALKGYLKESGADGLPKVVSKQKLDSLIAKGSIELWRGVGSKEAAKEFESGELYAGRGVWGNGTYSATGPDAEKVADRFAIHIDQETGNETPGYKMRFTLDKSAKVINFSDLRKEQDQTALNLRTEADISPKPWETRGLADIMSDAGRYAAIRGYDAIRITKPEPFNSDHVIIINRTKVIMEKVE